MKVYILSSLENTAFAEKILGDIKNVKIISERSVTNNRTDIDAEIKKNIENADVVLAIIDENFVMSKHLIFELQLAQLVVQENKNKLLIPLVLNNASIPNELEEIVCIFCDTKADSDLSRIKLIIEKILASKNLNIRESNKELSKPFPMIILTISIELFAIIYIFFFLKEMPFGYMNEENIINSLLGMVVVSLSVLTLITSYFSIMKRRRQEEEEVVIESYSRRLKKAIVPEEIEFGEKRSSVNEEKKKELDALGRMMINLEDIKEFYTWSQKQAKASFILAVAMCISGFLLMTVAVLLPVVFKLSLQMSIIPAIGGIITELIAGTALVVYRNSLAQLNHYHKALHEDERFLSSVNLIGKFSTVEVQDEMLQEIIRSEIQMNLAGLNDDKNIKSDIPNNIKK